MKEIVFNGGIGRLEGRYYHCEEKGAPVALVLHPHPLHGGTMNNKVVYHIFRAFVNKRFSVLRFNFRGVGKSAGVFDHGVGELLDAASALDWLQSTNPEASNYWLAGFSFGSWIALQLLMRRPEIMGFIAVSPPASSCDFNFLSPCPTQGLIVQGSDDQITSEDSVYKLYEKVEKQRNSDIEYALIDKADHFFNGRLEELDSVIDNYLEGRVTREYFPKKNKRDRRRRQNSSGSNEFIG